MKITLHRPHQIGGCITVIETDGVKVIIDLGSNLPGSNKEELTKAQVEEITAGADAIFFTHYHGDHTGLIHLIPEGIPQLIGKGAKEVMVCKHSTLVRASKRFEGVDSRKYQDAVTALAAAKRMQTYKDAERIDVGNKGKLFITPYFVSHSAFDAYMFLIEAEGKCILHTGDFRGHGYLSKGLWKLLPSAIGQVDILITEGTMLSRANERVQHESVIQAKARRLLHKDGKKNHYVVLCSSTDIDRLAGFHAACDDPYHKTMIGNGDLDELIFERENRAEIKDYRQFSKEEFMASGFNPLYPFVGKDSPIGKKLNAFMEKVGMGEEERNVIGTLVWLNAQESGTNGPLGAIHLFDGLLKGFDQVQEMMGIVQEYMNNVPKWIFKGYSSHEIFEKYDKPSLQPLPDKMPPAGFGMGIPRVGRNDPCPCGSGLKYKNCHGKYNS